MKPYQYEDELPEDMTQAEYDEWYQESFVVDGVRVGPRFPRFVLTPELERKYVFDRWDGVLRRLAQL